MLIYTQTLNMPSPSSTYYAFYTKERSLINLGGKEKVWQRNPWTLMLHSLLKGWQSCIVWDIKRDMPQSLWGIIKQTKIQSSQSARGHQNEQPWLLPCSLIHWHNGTLITHDMRSAGFKWKIGITSRVDAGDLKMSKVRFWSPYPSHFQVFPPGELHRFDGSGGHIGPKFLYSSALHHSQSSVRTMWNISLQ